MNKTIHSFLLAAFASIAGFLTSCTDYQDEIDALDHRVVTLEKLTSEVNTNISTLQTIITAMDAGDFITNVTETSEGTIINFAKYGAVTVKNGTPGTNATVPDISIKQDTDGNYYWTLNGDWITVAGQKVRVNGEKGDNGNSPIVRINEQGLWEYSTDGGATFTTTTTPAQGNDGQSASDAIIVNVVKDASAKVVRIYLKGIDSPIEIPIESIIYVESVDVVGDVNSHVTLSLGGATYKEFPMSATVTPVNATYKDLLWYIYEWDNAATTYANAVYIDATTGKITATAPCTVKVRCLAKFGKVGDNRMVKDDITVIITK